MNKDKKVAHSFASYHQPAGNDSVTDLVELSKILLNWGEFPKSVNDTKAYELHLLAQGFLDLYSANEERKAKSQARLKRKIENGIQRLRSAGGV